MTNAYFPITSSYFNVLYPSNGVIQLDGGLNNKFEKVLIIDNDSPDCLNVQFINGSVQTRGGSTRLNANTITTAVCDGLYTRRDQSGSETMIAFHGGLARYWTGSTFTTIPSAQSVFPAGQRVGSAQFLNKIFFGASGVNPYKYDGTNWTLQGVPAPASAASALTTATAFGTANVSYSWRYTWVNSFSVEGNASPAVTFTASSTVSLTGIGIAPQSYGVSARYIYRATAAVGGTYFRIGTINDNTTTTFSDDGSAPQAGVTMPLDNGVPPNWSFCVYHQRRLFVNDSSNPNFIWYSNLDAPYTFSSSNFIKVGDATSDLIKGLEIYENSLLINCENSQWLNYMPDTTPADWSQIRILSPMGCQSPFGCWKWNNQVGFPAFQNTKFVGFATVNGQAINPSATFLTVGSAGSNYISDKIEPDMFNVLAPYAGNISTIVYKNKAYISLTYNSGTQNNRIYLFDFSKMDLNLQQGYSWCPISGINAAQFAILGGNLYYGSSTTDGYVYQMETANYNDNNTAINSYLWTKIFSGLPGHENLLKDFRRIKFMADLAGSYYMNLSYRIDDDTSQGTVIPIYLNAGASTWGPGMVWGKSVWGSGQTDTEFDISLGQTYGKRIQFKFDNQNALNQRFKIYRMQFFYNIRGIS